MKRYFSTFDAARHIGVSAQAIRKASERGDIVPACVTIGGRLLFDFETLATWREQRGAAAPGRRGATSKHDA